MATHCLTSARSGSGEHQNIGAVNSFEGKNGGGGGGGQLHTRNQIGVVQGPTNRVSGRPGQPEKGSGQPD